MGLNGKDVDGPVGGAGDLASTNVHRFALVDVIGAGALFLIAGVVNLTVLVDSDVRAGVLWSTPAALACLVAGLAGALRIVPSRPLAAVALIALGHGIVAVVVPVAWPFLWPMLVLTVVIPLVLAAPYVPLRFLVWLIAATAAVASAAALIGLRADDAGVVPDIADGVELAIVVTALSLLMVPIGLVVWQNNRSQRRSLDDALHLNAELVRSRRRVVEASDDARRRIERDLHDGAQQRLVSLAMRLRLLDSQLNAGTDPVAPLSETISGLVDDVDQALDELRDLAHGVYPPVLASQGLVAAFGAVARSSPASIAVTDRTGDRPRPPQAVEEALYFAGLEAVANAVKHAGAGEIEVVVEARDDELGFRVSDEGPGFDPAQQDEWGRTPQAARSGREAQTRSRSSNGLANIRDRVGSLGGSVAIDSSPDGTVVSASIPLSG